MTVSDDQISAWLHGSLSNAEAQHFEALVARDAQLAKRAEELRRLDNLFRQAVPLDEQLPAELLARLGLDTPSAASNVVDFKAARAARIQAAPGAPARFTAFAQGGWRIAAQVMIVLGLGFTAATWIGAPGPREPAADYRVLGDAAAVTVGANALVMFAEGTAASQVRAIAGRVGARVAGGPNSAGAWQLSVAPERRNAVLDQLRSMPEVTMAEPIDGEAP